MRNEIIASPLNGRVGSLARRPSRRNAGRPRQSTLLMQLATIAGFWSGERSHLGCERTCDNGRECYGHWRRLSPARQFAVMHWLTGPDWPVRRQQLFALNRNHRFHRRRHLRSLSTRLFSVFGPAHCEQQAAGYRFHRSRSSSDCSLPPEGRQKTAHRRMQSTRFRLAAVRLCRPLASRLLAVNTAANLTATGSNLHLCGRSASSFDFQMAAAPSAL